MLKRTGLAALAMVLMATTTLAADIKIGYVTTLTTPAAVIGNDMKDAVDLAMEQLGGMMGGKSVEIIFEDDGFKPDIGKQKTDKLVQQDNVPIVAGYIWSNVLLASMKTVFDNGRFLISSNAGPSQIAGKQCNENFFSTSWQNDQTPMAMGEVLNQQGVKSLYLMGPNYAAGKDMLAGVQRTFKGEIKGQDLTKWPDQLDFSAELAKAKSSGAEAIFVFYPGKAGGAFIKQYQQAGLKGTMDLYSVFTVDAISLPKLQAGKLEGVLGSKMTQEWDPTLDNEANKTFVSSFREKYKRYPSFYAAQAYDTINLINSAVTAVGGDISKTDDLRAAFVKADYASVRGKYTVGKNHMPVQNFYLREVVTDADGNWTTKVIKTVFENHVDPYVSECPMAQ